MKTIVQVLTDTTAEWAKRNPVLVKGMVGVEERPDGSRRVKIGDGKKNWLDPALKAFSAEDVEGLLEKLSSSIANEAQARNEKDVELANAKQDKITSTGATNVLLAPASIGGQPGKKAISEFVQKSEVVDNLTSSSANTPLSAKQGKTLLEKITEEETARKNAITAEAQTRLQADTALQTNITAEETARKSAVAAEETARKNADTLLQTNITAEETARKSAVAAEETARKSAVAAEETARKNADTALQTSITAEKKDRQNAVTAEAQARQQGDNELMRVITDLISIIEFKLGKINFALPLTVEGGFYLVTENGDYLVAA